MGQFCIVVAYHFLLFVCLFLFFFLFVCWVLLLFLSFFALALVREMADQLRPYRTREQ